MVRDARELRRFWQPALLDAPGEAAQAAAAEPRARRSVGIYLLLLLLPLLVLLPLLLYSGSLLYLLAEQGRESTRRELEATSHALRRVVEREFEQTQETLAVVAGALGPEEAKADPQRARQLMQQVLEAGLGIERLALIGPDGQVLAELPSSDGQRTFPLSADKLRAFETGQPQVSNLRTSELDGRLGISISQPVLREDDVVAILSARVDPKNLASVMAEQVGRRDAVATLMDPMHRIVARSRNMDRFFGLRPSSEVLGVLTLAEGGVRRLPSLDGNDFLWAWSTTPSGYSVALGTPARAVDQALWESMTRLAAVGVLMLLLSLTATMFLARRIARSVDRMAENAPLLAQAEQPPYERSGIRQLDALYRALEQASKEATRALSDRDRALAAERSARQLADADNRAKDVFIATLSHELRNPLAPVRSAVHILKAPNASEAARARAAAVIERQVAAMARLLDDLLDLSRIRSGRIDLARRAVSLRAVLESAIEIARPLIDSREHRFSCNLPGPDVMLVADPLRLSQVFSNLLTNAAKYTDPGGRIDVWAEVRDEQVLVHVMDTGIGLAPEELEQVFEMFSQVRGPMDRSQGGLGIGLWLVRALVELHGGWVRAESAGPGRGSEFVVGLPLAPQERDEPATAGASSA